MNKTITSKVLRASFQLWINSYDPVGSQTLNTSKIFELAQNIGITTSQLYNSDSEYKVVSKDFWIELFKNPWWISKDELKFEYIGDFRDCDDYARFFKELPAMAWGINSVAKVAGECHWFENGEKKTSRHAFCMIPAFDNGELKLFLYDPMWNIFTEVTGKETITHGIYYHYDQFRI